MDHNQLSSIYKEYVALFDNILGTEDEFNKIPISLMIGDLQSKVKIDDNSLVHILTILEILGLISITENNEIIISSKYAAITMAAIRRRFQLDFPITFRLRLEEQKEYFRNFTKNLETIRKNSHNDNTPIHTRNLINIIMCGRQIRNWKYREVFLLEYHSGWNQYHLIGLGERGDKDLISLISKTLVKKINLKQQDYEIEDSISLPVIDYTTISLSNGAITHYKINTFIVKKINLKIETKLESVKSIKKGYPPPQFIWATREEIDQGEIFGYEIMDTTKLVLAQVEQKLIPNVAGTIKSYHFSPMLSYASDLKNRIDACNTFKYFFVGSLIIIFGLFSPCLVSQLNNQNTWLTNIASFSQILGFIFGIFVWIVGIKKNLAE
jgi:hypothetical protein